MVGCVAPQTPPQVIFTCPHCGEKVAPDKMEHFPGMMGYWPCCRKSAGFVQVTKRLGEG